MTGKLAHALAFGLLLSNCASYQYAKNVKLVSLDGNVASGRGVGPVQGESCQGFVFGYPLGERATLDRAIADSRERNHIRYLNNVSTEYSGFNAYVYASNCLVVKGTGYQ